MNPPTPAALWTGRVLSALVLLILFADALVNLLASDKIAPKMAETGFPIGLATPLGFIILACAIVYAIPRTAVIGAILISAFAGGAICLHFRIGEIGSPPQILAVAISVMAWAGVFLRHPTLRQVLPVVRQTASEAR